jgi:hypothetical protein
MQEPTDGQEMEFREICGFAPAAGLNPVRGAVVGVQVPSANVSIKPSVSPEESEYDPVATQESTEGQAALVRETCGFKPAAGLNSARGAVVAVQVPLASVSIKPSVFPEESVYDPVATQVRANGQMIELNTRDAGAGFRPPSEAVVEVQIPPSRVSIRGS